MSFCFVYGFLGLYKPNFGWGPNNGCCDQDTESVTAITRDLSSFFLILASEYAYWLRKRAMEVEKERVWERETLICCLSYAPHLGTELATQACTLIGNRTRDPLFYRKNAPTNWAMLTTVGSPSSWFPCSRALLPQSKHALWAAAHWQALSHIALCCISEWVLQSLVWFYLT